MDASRTWTLLELTIDTLQSEEAGLFLFDQGANGIQECECGGDTVVLRAYFNEDEKLVRSIERLVCDAFPAAEVTVGGVEWDPTDESWRQHFTPFEIVPGVAVAPTWERYAPKPGERVITMDPGMAFGTGLHPTTRMSALAIHDICSADETPASMLDVGCGSGLLCLVAHMLGIRQFQAVEIDADALEVARDNFKLNDVSAAALHETIDAVRDDFPLVVANILFNTLIELRDELLRVTAPKGCLVLSGITEGQVDELARAYAAHATLENRYAEGEWQCIVLRKDSLSS